MGNMAYLKKLCSENLPVIFADAFAAHLRGTDRGSSANIYHGEIRRFGKWVAERHGEFQPQAVTPLDFV